ncbi:MAG: 6,7-dimethyl-8-ribityllumazine synthase [Rhodobacteraceae bacterium]|nr:MAG: 6,7-dimethyl-8-ribityllumazine synthase [Paracoccaceae bacterium]
MAGTETHTTLPTPDLADIAPKLLIVVSPYYQNIADHLLAGAKAAITAAGAQFDVAHVPGALEIPPAIRIASASGTYAGFVALGCVIRGETTHYETVCNDSSYGLTQLGLQGLAIGNGILTVENRAQAVVRADIAGQNKGAGAANAALHLIALDHRFNKRTKGIGFKPASENVLMAGNPRDKSNA